MKLATLAAEMKLNWLELPSVCVCVCVCVFLAESDLIYM